MILLSKLFNFQHFLQFFQKKILKFAIKVQVENYDKVHSVEFDEFFADQILREISFDSLRI